MSKLRCIIFDMDGTLTQTNQLIFDAFNYIAFRYAGKVFSERQIIAMFGPPEEGALEVIVRKDRVDQALKEYLDFYRQHHSELAQLYPGIDDVLRYIKEQGRTLALFTGKGIYTTSITMDEFNLQQYFDLVVTGNDVQRHKPSADGINKIMAQLKLRPDEVLMVGDSVSDVKAAREANVQIAAVLWDSYGKEHVMQMETDYTFHNVEELHDWLKEEFERD